MTLALRYAVRSDVGLLREGNEDSAFAGPRLLAIADGMGGHAAGEVASAVAISTIAKLADDVPDNGLLDALARAVATANRTLHDMSLADPSVEGMGTTLTAMLWSGPRFGLCHIGDSRAYLLRGDEFRQITRDHTLVQALVDDGRISPVEAASHPQRSLLLRALDGSTEAEPDLAMLQARVGDRYLLCSDGLSDVVSEGVIHQTLAALPEPDQAVLKLIDLAIAGGGPDNITCIVADVVDSAATTLSPTEAPVLVGAASTANGSGMTVPSPPPPAPRRAQTLVQPAVAASVATAADRPPRLVEAADNEDAEDRPRRRWPIVTSLVVVLLVVVGGAAYAGWNYTQHQYYVGENDGEVAIFQGVSQDVAGLHLSHVYERTAIPLAGLPSTEASSIKSTITAIGGLAKARSIVSRVRLDYTRCQQGYARQADYQKALATYHSKLAAYQRKWHRTTTVTMRGKVVARPPAAPRQPAPIPPGCPAQPAQPAGAASSPGSGGSGGGGSS